MLHVFDIFLKKRIGKCCQQKGNSKILILTQVIGKTKGTNKKNTVKSYQGAPRGERTPRSC